MPEMLSFDALSVIIPTYNRERVLAKALEAYVKQSFPEFIHELLVIDDGSTDGTEAMVLSAAERSPFPIRYLRQSNKGPAAARNLGIQEAVSSIILFTDSDIVPQRDFVEQHLEWHRKNPQLNAAVLGYVTWPSEINPTPFMRWYGEEGALFGYGQIQGKREVDFHFFYTCNLSLKLNFLRASGQFDEDFKNAAYEDLELGYRLSKHGLRVLYNAKATAYHYQFVLFPEACRKTLANSASAQLFFRKEAGRQHLLETCRRRSRARYAISKEIATLAAKVLSPVRRWLDSSFPFPNVVYHLFFWHDATRPLVSTEIEGCFSSESPLGREV
jgi:glycosyltransferase involved in cell wall biosynthesis